MILECAVYVGIFFMLFDKSGVINFKLKIVLY